MSTSTYYRQYLTDTLNAYAHYFNIIFDDKTQRKQWKKLGIFYSNTKARLLLFIHNILNGKWKTEYKIFQKYANSYAISMTHFTEHMKLLPTHYDRFLLAIEKLSKIAIIGHVMRVLTKVSSKLSEIVLKWSLVVFQFVMLKLGKLKLKRD